MGNDVEVNYTGDELFHLNENTDLGYDGKIESRGEGAYAYYSTESNWNDHVHIEINKNGEETYHREEGKNHTWNHRQSDYISVVLQNLSFEELQIVESFSNNQYLRKSAQNLLNINNFETGLVKKYTL